MAVLDAICKETIRINLWKRSGTNVLISIHDKTGVG